MVPPELIRKIRRIEISTNRLVNNVFAGQYESIFKGRGVAFSEVREYVPGDEVRCIDWNVTARTGHPYVKRFTEERELTVMLLADLSASREFGTRGSLKATLQAEVAALLAFSAIRNHDRVGLIAFTDRVEKFVPPKKGRRHVLRVIRELLYLTPEGRGTNLNVPLEYLGRVLTKQAVVFLLSDFFADGYARRLRIATRWHDIVALVIGDPRERDLPSIGILEAEDPETGRVMTVDARDPRVREAYRLASRSREEATRRLLRSMGVDLVELTTGESYVEPLVGFFAARAKRLRRWI